MSVASPRPDTAYAVLSPSQADGVWRGAFDRVVLSPAVASTSAGNLEDRISAIETSLAGHPLVASGLALARRIPLSPGAPADVKALAGEMEADFLLLEDLSGEMVGRSYTAFRVVGDGPLAPAAFAARHGTPFVRSGVDKAPAATPTLGATVALGLGSVSADPVPYVIDQEHVTITPSAGLQRVLAPPQFVDYSVDAYVACEEPTGYVMFQRETNPRVATADQFEIMDGAGVYGEGTVSPAPGEVLGMVYQIRLVDGSPISQSFQTTLQVTGQ